MKKDIYTHKSLKIYKTDDGQTLIFGLRGHDIISEIIPDAVVFINNECPLGATLKNLNGVDLFVMPNANVDKLVEQWKYENFKLSGLEF